MIKKGSSYSFGLNLILAFSSRNFAIPGLNFIFNKTQASIIEMNMLADVSGMKASCNKKGITENTATPNKMDREINRPGFRSILNRFKMPKPAINWMIVNSRMIIMPLIR
jgi:hypothetical protein